MKETRLYIHPNDKNFLAPKENIKQELYCFTTYLIFLSLATILLVIIATNVQSLLLRQVR